MSEPTTREQAEQADRLGRQMTNQADREKLLKLAADLRARADREDAEAGISDPSP
jgi:hypothetical protein